MSARVAVIGWRGTYVIADVVVQFLRMKLDVKRHVHALRDVALHWRDGEVGSELCQVPLEARAHVARVAHDDASRVGAALHDRAERDVVGVERHLDALTRAGDDEERLRHAGALDEHLLGEGRDAVARVEEDVHAHRPSARLQRHFLGRRAAEDGAVGEGLVGRCEAESEGNRCGAVVDDGHLLANGVIYADRTQLDDLLFRVDHFHLATRKPHSS